MRRMQWQKSIRVMPTTSKTNIRAGGKNHRFPRMTWKTEVKWKSFKVGPPIFFTSEMLCCLWSFVRRRCFFLCVYLLLCLLLPFEPKMFYSRVCCASKFWFWVFIRCLTSYYSKKPRIAIWFHIWNCLIWLHSSSSTTTQKWNRKLLLEHVPFYKPLQMCMHVIEPEKLAHS